MTVDGFRHFVGTRKPNSTPSRFARSVAVAAVPLSVMLVTASSAAQSPTPWPSIRERAVALAQEVDAVQTKLTAPTPQVAAIEAALASDHFTVAYLALRRSAASTDARIRGLALRQVLMSSKTIVVVAKGVGVSYVISNFNPTTGQFEYRPGNGAPGIGRLEGLTITLPMVHVPDSGACKASIEFGPDLDGRGRSSVATKRTAGTTRAAP